MTNLKNFQLPENREKLKPEASKFNFNSAIKKPQNFRERLLKLLEKRFGSNAKITRFISKFSSNITGDEQIDALNQIKRTRLLSDRLNSTLTVILLLILIFGWKWGLPLLAEADQLENDLKEQAQVIKMEKSNQSALERLTKDQKSLSDNIQKVYAAVPKADEKAEAVISMLEDMATNNRMVIDAIGIRAVPESQIYYDDLIGSVDIYEYSFAVESELPNILSFITSIRSSLRLMDLMSLEIEEKEAGLYRAGFVLNAYNLVPMTNIPVPNDQ